MTLYGQAQPNTKLILPLFLNAQFGVKMPKVIMSANIPTYMGIWFFAAIWNSYIDYTVYTVWSIIHSLILERKRLCPCCTLCKLISTIKWSWIQVVEWLWLWWHLQVYMQCTFSSSHAVLVCIEEWHLWSYCFVLLN